jgi:hypothetical protein
MKNDNYRKYKEIMGLMKKEKTKCSKPFLKNLDEFF